MEIQREVEEWHEQRCIEKGKDRDSLLRNSGVLFQSLAGEAAVISALRSIEIDPDADEVLDVGCASGGSLLNFMKLYFSHSHLTGIDIVEERIEKGRDRFPNINFVHGNAADMEFRDESFDIVFESTMLTQITDDNLISNMASEMIRVTRTKGYIILVDWRYSKPFNKNYRGLSIRRMKRLFEVDSKTILHSKHRGALVPPIGRFISKRVPAVYFLIKGLLPFLVGQIVVVLQKLESGDGTKSWVER